MSEFEKEALDRLAREFKGGFGAKANAMKQAVRDALESFIRQDGEFAQAVAQSKGSFSDCMKAVADGVGQSISDLEAYRRAVRFYFPGAEIRMQMTIDLIGGADDTSSVGSADSFPSRGSLSSGSQRGIILNLEDFL